MRIADLAGAETTPALRACLDGLDPGAPSDYRELAALLATHWRAGSTGNRTRRVGLAGGQGTGKSTLARLIAQACDGLGLRTCVLALDDYYLPRAERRALAGRVHPLFETRGPPGTHDVACLREHLGALATAATVEIPVFDKGLDDRVGTRALAGPFELVVLEGWCVGAQAVPDEALRVPCNALERDEDRDGRWRRAANEALASGYAALFATLDELVYLRPPDLDSVRRWRLEQEAERPAERRMDAPAIERFVAHYERITEAMRASLPGRAAWTIELARDHSIAGIVRRARGRSPGG